MIARYAIWIAALIAAGPALAERLDAEFGPWSVSGPALEYGIRALANRQWQQAMRQRLAADAEQLDALLAARGIAVDGGTSLFRHVTTGDAARLFEALGTAGILVRNFSSRPHTLRFGLPGGEDAWRRLEQALAVWDTNAEEGGSVPHDKP